jgi:F-box protein, helicase, 18
MAFELTDEQITIRNCCVTLQKNESLKINAFAGAGKTSTLTAITDFMPKKNFLYLAFNNSIVKEAQSKFNSNVFVTTTHSLAYSQIIDENGYTLKKGDDYSIHDLKNILNCREDVAFDVIKIFSIFCNTSYKNISETRMDYTARTGASFTFAEKFYDLMKNNEIEVNHNFYLKEFSLNGDLTRYSFDYILLDEAQDTNPVVLNVFKRLVGAKILVGDTHQTIYQFRGSVNVMETYESTYTFYLSTTFRCTENIVADANKILSRYKGEKIPIVSKATKKEVKNCAYISRTNSQLIFLIAKFQDFRLYKDVDELFMPAIQIHLFLSDKKDSINSNFEFLKNKKDKAELVEYIERYELIELSTALRIAEMFKGYLYVLRKKAKDKNNKKSKNIFITAHKSKGLEFDSVVLESDFKNLTKIDNESKLIEEANLLYVAITRAKYKITYKGEHFVSIFN